MSHKRWPVGAQTYGAVSTRVRNDDEDPSPLMNELGVADGRCSPSPMTIAARRGVL